MMATGAQEAIKESEIDKNSEDNVIKKDELSTSDSELDALKRALEESRENERSLKEQVTKERTEKTEVVSKLSAETGNRLSAEEVAIVNGLAAATSEAERIERELVDAQENGKFADAAKLSRQLASAQNKIDKWEGDKNRFEQFREQQKNRPAKPDPLASFTPASREWIEKNPRFLSDSKFKAKVLAAHYEADADGVPLDSDEYFMHLDNAVKGKTAKPEEPEEDVEQVRQEVKPQKQATRSAAPPSRGASNTNMSKQGNGQIKLTAQQVEAAIFSNPKLPHAEAIQRYSEGLNKAIESGKMNSEGRYVG